jgi:hypothetical protein
MADSQRNLGGRSGNGRSTAYQAIRLARRDGITLEQACYLIE